MQFIFTPAVILTSILIFVVRVASITMDTLRFMLTMRGKQGIAWILGFIESVLYVVIIGAVLKELSNVLYVVAYSAGFATGNVVGMAIEKRLAIGFSHRTCLPARMSASAISRCRALPTTIDTISISGFSATFFQSSTALSYP